MLVEEIYSNLKTNGIVKNKEHFSEMYLECDRNYYYYLTHKKRDMSLGNMMKCYKNISFTRPMLTVSRRKQVDECLHRIQKHMTTKYNIKLFIKIMFNKVHLIFGSFWIFVQLKNIQSNLSEDFSMHALSTANVQYRLIGSAN